MLVIQIHALDAAGDVGVVDEGAGIVISGPEKGFVHGDGGEPCDGVECPYALLLHGLLHRMEQQAGEAVPGMCFVGRKISHLGTFRFEVDIG